MRRASLSALVVLVTLGVASPAAAESEADRLAAAAVADAALDRFERGEVASALALFVRASLLVPSATFALYEARCLEKLDHLDAANEAYGRAESLADGKSATPAQKRAGVQAKAEREAMLRRAREALRPAAAPKPIPDAAPPPPRPVVAAAVPPPPEAPAPAPVTGMPKAQLVALGVGATGVVVGVVSGAMMMSRKSSLDDACQSGTCPASSSGDLDAYRTARDVSLVSWGVGLAALGVGAGLWLTGSRGSAPGPSASVGVGPRGAALNVTF